jgi:hypothetical protein
MSLALLAWLFTLGVLLHNLEEALYLPAWSELVGRWYRPVAASTFRFAAATLSVLLVLLTVFGSLSRPGAVGAYLMVGYVLAMVLNVVVPHAFVTIVQRRYMPGTATALLLNLPLGLLYLHRALGTGYIELRTFLWTGPAVVIALILLTPLLFALVRRFGAAFVTAKNADEA